MAFPTINAQQELNNRKILEDLHLKKQLLQKVVGNPVTPIVNIPTSNASLTPQYLAGSQPPQTIQQGDSLFNSPARAAFTQASTQSLGFFIPQDSLFGNNILPVLPRFDSAPK